jgi:hypothetical protein
VVVRVGVLEDLLAAAEDRNAVYHVRILPRGNVLVQPEENLLIQPIAGTRIGGIEV